MATQFVMVELGTFRLPEYYDIFKSLDILSIMEEKFRF